MFSLYVCVFPAGTPALTSRGFTEEDFERVAEFFDQAVKIAVDAKGKSGT